MLEGGALSLTAFGLPEEADLVWATLLRWPDITLAELAARVEMPAALVSPLLSDLRDAGLVCAASNRLGVAPLDPSVVVEQRIALQQRDLATRLDTLSRMRADLPALTDQFTRGAERLQSHLEMEILEGIDAIRAFLGRCAETVRSESLSLDDCTTTPDGLNASRPYDYARLERGVTSKSILASPAVASPATFAYFDSLSKAGEQVRTTAVIPARCVIHDREVAILPVDSGDVRRAAVVVRARTIID